MDFRSPKITAIPFVHLVYSFICLLFSGAFITFLCVQNLSKEPGLLDEDVLLSVVVFAVLSLLGTITSLWVTWRKNRKICVNLRIWVNINSGLTLLKLITIILFGVIIDELSVLTFTPFTLGVIFTLLDLVCLLFVIHFLKSILPVLPPDSEEFINKPLHQRMRILRTSRGKLVSNYYNTVTKDPVNLELGAIDGLYHHHYGIGQIGPEMFTADEETIKNEMHRLETCQAQLLISYLGDLQKSDRAIDLGSGRGGGSLLLNMTTGCTVDGVSVSDYQVNFANAVAKENGVEDRVRYHFRNMLDTGFPNETFQAAWNNESSMYVDLNRLYGEVNRILVKGGRYVCITATSCWKVKSDAVNAIDKHYDCKVHTRNAYLKALLANDFTPLTLLDLTQETLPYWELRNKSALVTGVEKHFLEAFKNGSFRYILIAAVKN